MITVRFPPVTSNDDDGLIYFARLFPPREVPPDVYDIPDAELAFLQPGPPGFTDSDYRERYSVLAERQGIPHPDNKPHGLGPEEPGDDREGTEPDLDAALAREGKASRLKFIRLLRRIWDETFGWDVEAFRQ